MLIQSIALIAWFCAYTVVAVSSFGYLAIRGLKTIGRRSAIRSGWHHIGINQLLTVVSVAGVGALLLWVIRPGIDSAYRIYLWIAVCAILPVCLIALRTRQHSAFARFGMRALPIYVVVMFGLTALISPTASVVKVPLRSDQKALPAADADRIPGEFPNTRTAVGDLHQRDCVNVTPQDGHSRLSKIACGVDSSFRVIQVVRDRSECIGDVDMIYTSTTLNYSACLDYDWSADRCLLIRAGTPVQKVTCTVEGAERVESIIVPAESADACGNGGFSHAIRKFTVCTSTTE